LKPWWGGSLLPDDNGGPIGWPVDERFGQIDDKLATRDGQGRPQFKKTLEGSHRLSPSTRRVTIHGCLGSFRALDVAQAETNTVPMEIGKMRRSRALITQAFGFNTSPFPLSGAEIDISLKETTTH
jgi:hypothetical protein